MTEHSIKYESDIQKDIDNLRDQLEEDTDEFIKSRIEKQIELLEDAIIVYRISRSETNG